MLRYFADVQDTNSDYFKHLSSNGDFIQMSPKTRLDISLYQRNDKNMEELFTYLLHTVPFFHKSISDVKKIAGMKITDVPDYQYASIYHVGLIEENEIPALLKFHFFTRWCEDPNHHTREGYRDKEYLEYLQTTGIVQFEHLAKIASKVMENCGGHLWMAGIDLACDYKKYKIYIKNINDAYKYLIQILEEPFVKHLQTITCWNKNHKECRLAGLALGLNSKNMPSVNLYYHVD